ncbi:MAG: hypothetical protein SynsKO_03720 [Synoicihabitans sp.]
MKPLRIPAPDLETWIESRSGELWADLLDAVEDMIFVKNLDGLFVYNNAAHLAFLGKSREAVHGQSDFDLFPAAEAEGFFAHDTRLLETEQPVVSAHPARDEEGNAVVDLAVKRVVRGLTDEVLGLVGIVKRIPVGADPTACRARVKVIVRRLLPEGVAASQLAALDQSVAALLEIPGS